MNGREAMLQIEAAIARAYRDDEWKRFWPSHFVLAGMPEAQAVEGLKRLVEAGHLDVEVTLRCPEGHVAKHGRPEEFTAELEVTCLLCEAVAEAAEGLEMEFTITEAWRRSLDELFDRSEKKSPEAAKNSSCH